MAWSLRTPFLLCVYVFSVAGIVAGAASSQAQTTDTRYPAVIFSAEYEGEFDGWDVEMNRSLVQTADNAYTLRSKASNLFASIEETSDFTLADGYIKPNSYAYARKIFGKKKVERLDFDWQKNRVTYTRSDRKGSETQHALKPGFLDPSSYQLALQADVRNDVGKLNYQFVKRSKIKDYEFKVIGEQGFKIEGNAYNADLVRRENDDASKTTTAWVLPKLDYQLAKIEHIDDGDKYELILTEYKGNSDALNAFYKILARQPKELANTYAQDPLITDKPAFSSF